MERKELQFFVRQQTIAVDGINTYIKSRNFEIRQKIIQNNKIKRVHNSENHHQLVLIVTISVDENKGLVLREIKGRENSESNDHKRVNSGRQRVEERPRERNEKEPVRIILDPFLELEKPIHVGMN